MNIDTKFDDGPNSESEDRPIFHSKESWRNESEFFFLFRKERKMDFHGEEFIAKDYRFGLINDDD